jgi:hypothetical protein
MSFGPSSRIHAARFLELSLDLPIVVECVDTEEKIQEILPELDQMVGGGLITLERVKVIMYRPHAKEEEQPDDWSIDIGSTPKAQSGQQSIR